MTEAAAYLQSRIAGTPRVLLVLGSGLGTLAEQVQAATTIPFAEIPGFVPATVPGHSGVVLSGTLEEVPCLVLQGRLHMYEGISAQEVALPVRVAAELGAEVMIVTNAAGGINTMFQAGDLMIMDDHINLMWHNPLLGPVQRPEPRFPDMSAPYDRELSALARNVATQLGQRVQEGTYLGGLGPAYETPAEITMYRRMGADAVGMSTVPEVIAAHARGLRVLGISVITNAAAGYTGAPLSHGDVLAASRAASDRLSALVRGVLVALR